MPTLWVDCRHVVIVDIVARCQNFLRCSHVHIISCVHVSHISQLAQCHGCLHTCSGGQTHPSYTYVHIMILFQTLYGGNYGLLNRTNFEPNPDFYIGKLFHDLMGNSVLAANVSFNGSDATGYLRMYAQCTRGAADMTLLVMNVLPNTTVELSLSDIGTVASRDDYAITAHDLTSRYINLNGNPVTVNDGVLPTLTPQSVTGSAAGTLSVQPRSIVFSVVKGPTSVCSAGPAV
eukprot:m.1520983 g.1520983  ORF g.1520983 m.1520983 type:complete len:233 (-) comp25229_c0_seq4:3435-4133(-)